MNKSIHGQEMTPLMFITRNQALEGIIFELKETLKGIKDNPNAHYKIVEECEEVLKKYNKSWDELYKEIDGNVSG